MQRLSVEVWAWDHYLIYVYIYIDENKGFYISTSKRELSLEWIEHDCVKAVWIMIIHLDDYINTDFNILLLPRTFSWIVR